MWRKLEVNLINLTYILLYMCGILKYQNLTLNCYNIFYNKLISNNYLNC